MVWDVWACWGGGACGKRPRHREAGLVFLYRVLAFSSVTWLASVCLATSIACCNPLHLDTVDMSPSGLWVGVYHQGSASYVSLSILGEGLEASSCSIVIGAAEDELRTSHQGPVCDL